MFGLFNKKPNKPSVIPEDKEWVENSLIWLIECFGTKTLLSEPFITPTKENFPYTNYKDNEQFKQLFNQVCGYWNVDPNSIVVKFYDDHKTLQWSTWLPQGEFSEPGGLYYQDNAFDDKPFNIELAKSNLDHPQLLISVMSHELAHVKLLGGKYINQDSPDMEPLTDLATIFKGFGIFMANSCETRDEYYIGRSGYLPNEVIAYANALLCHISNKNPSDYASFLNTNTRSLFLQDFEYLKQTGDTTLTFEKIAEANELFLLYEDTDHGFKNRDFDKVIESSKALLQINPKNIAALNNWGYGLLLQKKYSEAIEKFNLAIQINRHFDYAVNNRGYCKLQLGDLDNALPDLNSSYQMNPTNSFSLRNLGAYYLQKKELDRALGYFEKSFQADPKTEMIHFYLSHTHSQLGNMEKAKEYYEKSKAMNECNDSRLDDKPF
jgi:tetratricopeptide (TPR) repeat protein